jgi:hypothetical protein
MSCAASYHSEDLVEHAEPAPLDETVVGRLRRTVLGGSITPTRSVPDHKDDTADDPTIIDRGTPCDSGKHGSVRRICASDSQIRSLMATPRHAAIESTDHYIRK